MTEETGVPAEVALLWGLHEAPRRGPKPALTVADITQAAVEVADAEGLAAVSMAKVAARLGSATMALYRHVKSKDELLLLMSDSAFEMPPQQPEGTGWREGLTAWTYALLAALQRHPWFANIPITGPPLGPRNLAWFDLALQALADTGLKEADKVGVVMVLTTYLHGEIRLKGTLIAGYRENPGGFGAEYGAALAKATASGRYPGVDRLVAAGVFEEQSGMSFEEEMAADFKFGLDMILDGIGGFILRCRDEASGE